MAAIVAALKAHPGVAAVAEEACGVLQLFTLRESQARRTAVSCFSPLQAPGVRTPPPISDIQCSRAGVPQTAS